jgi:hypothetical protein
VFNSEYQKRATRQGIRSFFAQEFYRPLARPNPCPPRRVKKPGPEQLRLNFEPTPRYFSDAECPLRDIFPMAY